MRQRELRRSKQFVCACPACVDPCEEGGTCAGCMRCHSCGHGWQSQDPLKPMGEWRCAFAACGGTTPYEEVIRWDDEQRAALSSLLQAADALPARAVETQLRDLIATALNRCHPNHALLLQARLALVAFGFDDSDGSPQRKLVAAQEALLLAERILPPADAQKADLLFQIGVGLHAQAQRVMAEGRLAVAHAPADAQKQRDAARAAARGAAEATKAAAEAMVRSARQWSSVQSEGIRAAPCKAAKEFAELCLSQLR